MAARVPDASLIAAFVFGEDRAAEAESRLGSARLCAPSLWRYELANVAWRKVQQHPRERDAAALGLALAMSLPVEDLDPDHAEVLELAIEHKLTAYDASYLWVARRLRAPLATFDRRLAAAASRL